MTAGPRVLARQARFAVSQGRAVNFEAHPTDSAAQLNPEERSLNMHILDLGLTQAILASADMLNQLG